MLVVTSWATQAWLKQKFNHFHLPPSICTAQEDHCWRVTTIFLHLCFCSQHTYGWMLREEPGESGTGWSSQGCHTNWSWCCWVRGMQLEAVEGDVQLPCPLAHSPLVSPHTPSPDRPCSLQGIQGQLINKQCLELQHGEGLLLSDWVTMVSHVMKGP